VYSRVNARSCYRNYPTSWSKWEKKVFVSMFNLWTTHRQLHSSTQEAQLSQRDRATRYASWNLVSCGTAERKSHLKKTAAAEWPWRSPKVIETTSIRYAISNYIYHKRWSTVSMTILHRYRHITTFTVYTTAVSKTQPQATRAFRFTSKQIVVNACYISRGKLEKFQTAKVTFEVTQDG